jgi:hypothetical protein
MSFLSIAFVSSTGRGFPFLSVSSLFFAAREAKQKAQWPGSAGKRGQVIDMFALLA